MKSLRIVIADDEPITRMDVREMLQEAGHVVVAEAGDGETAIALVRSHHPDLVLLDVKMPVLDGLAAARVIHRERLAPVLLLTAYSQVEIIEQAKESGVLGYLVKPIRESDLLPMVEVVSAKHREFTDLEREVHELKDALETRKVVDRAKGILMETQGLSEAAAYRRIQQLSMEGRSSMRKVAEGIIAALDPKASREDRSDRAGRQRALR